MKVYPPNLLCKLKLFLCFNPSFHYGLQKVLSRGRVRLGLQGRAKLGNSLFSCEIIMSGLMKPTEKFVPFYMLAKNKKMSSYCVSLGLSNKLYVMVTKGQSHGRTKFHIFKNLFLAV